VNLRGRRTSGARVSRKAWALPAAALALTVLTGCSELTPGTAAVVNGTRITNDEVNDLADAQCVAADRAAQSGNSTTMAVSGIKQQSLGVLMDTELSLQYARDEDITAQEGLAKGFYSQFEPGITPLPSTARSVLSKVFKRWAESRAVLVEAGSDSTGQKPSFTNIEQLVNAGLKERAAWLKKADIKTDPRYAPDKDGFPGAGDGSVSRASSDFAKGATADETDPKWVGGLPAKQRCG
jgi:hypothetical protein